MSSTTTDSESSVIFVGTSTNIKTAADVHPEQEKFGNNFVLETPPRYQTTKRKPILRTHSVPDTQQEQENKATGKYTWKIDTYESF